MRNLPLNQHRVDRLKPRNSTYDIRDTDLKGFGIRILPSGKKSYFLQTQYEGRRRWTKISDANAKPEAEARSQARSLLAGIRKGQENAAAFPSDIPFEAVADEVFAYYRRHWKPRTLAVNLNYYQNNILPWFKERPIAGITRPEVLEWFESLHAKPASANRSLPVLSVILRQAEVYGYRPEDSNPCKDIKRYRRRARERFLSPDEIRRVVEVLNCYVKTRPFQVAVIRLLLLTGCRKSELLRFRPQMAGLPWKASSSCGIARTGRARSGFRPPRGRSWTGYPGIVHGSFLRVGGTWTICRISQVSGGMCARKPACAMSGRTISGTPTPASPSCMAKPS